MVDAVAAGPAVGPSDEPSGRDILVVDDAAANLIAVEAALAPLGYRVVLATSGPEALARLLEQEFAVILLDVQMPGMSGYECAQLIRSRGRTRATPIIFMTAFSRDESEVLEAYKLGAVDFLFKPVHPDVLRGKISVFVALHDAHSRERARAVEDQRRRLEAEALMREAEAQRKAAAELATLNQALATADRKKDEFLAILGHELRNPLAALLTALEVVRENRDRPLSPRTFAILERQLGQVTRLVDDLLEVSRITAGKIELRRGVVDFAAIVRESLASLGPQLASRRHELRAAPAKGPLYVDGDPVRLAQIVTNLLQNAAKYTPAGGVIEVTWGTRAGRAFVRVADNGRGIPADLLDRVFEMFVQERTGPDGGDGLGLGLALVQRLVAMHGGRVSADSSGPGQGSTFEVELPLVELHTMPELTPVTDTEPLARRRRIVVVDDNEDLRELMMTLLAAAGHDVHSARDATSGLALIMAERPDAALIDIGLPDLDGHEVARRVREALPDRALRLVAMTGYGQERDREAALAAGFDVHITKPASASTILQALGD